MDFAEYVKFATDNPVTYIATADSDQPRVRAFTGRLFDEGESREARFDAAASDRFL